MKVLKKVRAIIIKCIFGMMIALCLCSRCVLAQSSSGEKLSNGKAYIATKHLKISVMFGYNGYAKYGNAMPVRAEIHNNSSESYEGILRIVFRNNEKRPMIQKRFSVKKESKVKLTFNIPIMFLSEKYSVVICDAQGNDISYRDVELNTPDMNSYIYTGILSDTPSKLKYIGNIFTEEESSSSINAVTGRSFNIKEKDLKSYEKISALDLIVMENYNVTRLSDSMISNIRKWISNGGTVLIGCDNSKSTKVILDKLLEDSKENNSSTIEIENSVEQNFIKLDVGKGNILLSNFSLNIQKEIWSTYGYNIMCEVKENLSEVKKSNLINGDFSMQTGDSAVDYRFDALKINPYDRLPNLKLYGIILAIYVALAGPVMFVWYKKKGKTVKLWIMVPALAFVFSFIIYALGTTTRIQEPFINYLSQIRLDDSEEKHEADTLFSITNVTNEKYKVPIKSKCSIFPVNLSVYYDTPGKYKKGFDYGVDCTNDKNELMINRMSGFERAGFLSKHETDINGNVDIDIMKDDKKIYGSITNRLSCDLKNCVIYYSGNLVKIGDIKSGETVSIDKKFTKFYMTEEYDFDIEKEIYDAMGLKLYDTSLECSKRRKCGLLEAYLSENVKDTPFLYGYIEDAKKGFSDMTEYDSYGETGVCKQFDIKETYWQEGI